MALEALVRDLPPACNHSQLIMIRGCVTPRQLEALKDQLDGVDMYDDAQMDQLDGWDILTPENRDVVRTALIEGHVDDEVWRGVRIASLLLSRADILSTGARAESTWHERHQSSHSQEVCH